MSSTTCTPILPARRLFAPALLAVLLTLPASIVPALPADAALRWARYEFPDGSPIPGATHLRLSLPEAASPPEGEGVWWRMEVVGADGPMFAVQLRAADLDFLVPGTPPVPIHRYLLERQGKTLAYEDAATGAAALPRLHFYRHLLPRANHPRTEPDPFFVRGTWLGKPIQRQDVGREAPSVDLSGVHVLALDGDVIVGTSRDFRDDRSGRLYEPIADYRRDGPEYTWVPLGAEDYREMMAAGFNILRVPPEHLDLVVDEPVWVVTRSGFDERPDMLFRPNFVGAVMYMDEPAFRAMAFERLFGDVETTHTAATAVRELTAGRHAGRGSYGSLHLQQVLASEGWDLGGVVFPQPDYPVWETVSSACWYEMEAGVSGWLMEGRNQPAWFADLVGRVLGVDFPADAESNLRFHHAFFTGAARRFGAHWGTAIYGMMHPEAAARSFALAYDQGATYFWMWTSAGAHHVPFDEQLAHARALRAYQAAHPRPSRRARIEAARVAVALPWGYQFDKYALHTYPHFLEGFDRPRMWWSRHMELTADNGQGRTYGEVLAEAAAAAADLLRAGTAFDFIYLHDDEEPPAHYERVLRVRAAAMP